MIVVLMIVEMLIPRDAVSKVYFTRETTVGQNLHCPIYRGVSHARIMVTDGPINIFNASMPFVVEENIKNQLTVRRQFKLPALQVLHEYLHFRRKNFHTLWRWLCRGQQLDDIVIEDDHCQHQKKDKACLNDTFFHPKAEIAAHQ